MVGGILAIIGEWLGLLSGVATVFSPGAKRSLIACSPSVRPITASRLLRRDPAASAWASRRRVLTASRREANFTADRWHHFKRGLR